MHFFDRHWLSAFAVLLCFHAAEAAKAVHRGDADDHEIHLSIGNRSLQEDAHVHRAPQLHSELDEELLPVSWQELDSSKVMCAVKETPFMPDKGGKLAGLTGHSVMCDKGEFLQQWAMLRQGTQYKFSYKCCVIAKSVTTCDQLTTPLKESEGSSLLALRHHASMCGGQTLMRGWQVKEVAGKASITTMCCSLGDKGRLGKCKDAMTKPKAGSPDARKLSDHSIGCGAQAALTRWSLQVENLKQVSLTYTCCVAGEVASLDAGLRRTCRWVGDPHFLTFDGGRHDTTLPGTGETYWIVKSKDVLIQSYYEGMTPTSPALTKAIVVSGRFLKGHKLVIKKDVPQLRGHLAVALLDLASNSTAPATRNVVTWDGREVPQGREFRANGLVAISRKGGQVRASLPLGIVLDVKQNSHWMDQALTMSQPPGGQQGQCGNNNGDAGDDGNLQGSFPVPQQANMLIQADTAQEGKTGLLLSDCVGAKRRTAESLCRAKFVAKNTLQDYLDMCIFDACFSETPEELVEQDAQVERQALRDYEATQPRHYRSVGPARGLQAPKACKGNSMMAKISSAKDQQSFMEAIVQRKVSSSYVWGGARFHKGKWTWVDGSPMCGFQNWDDELKRQLKKPPHQFMCVNKRTGKWKTCAAGRRLHVICADQKKYHVREFTGPLQAKKSCGADHGLTMPKSKRDNDLVKEYLETSPLSRSYIWLGASWKNGRWEWDDGSKVCYTNWDKGEPKLPLIRGQMWIAMHVDTGKWKAVQGYKKFHHVLCENQMSQTPCPPSKLSPGTMGLSKLPGAMYSHFGGHCYYMGQGTESCHETCFRQMDGYCSQAGLNAAVTSKGTCKMIVQGFRGIAQKSKTKQDPGETGCSYKDMGAYGRISLTEVILEKRKDQMPTCEARTSNSKHHRICACGSSLQLQYPVKHIITTGETLRSCAQGYSSKQSIKLELYGERGKEILGIQAAAPPGTKAAQAEAEVAADAAPGETGKAAEVKGNSDAGADAGGETGAAGSTSEGGETGDAGGTGEDDGGGALLELSSGFFSPNQTTNAVMPENTVWMWLKQSPAYQSSTTNGGLALRAVDGDSNPQWAGGSCTHTAYQDNPWWMVDLGQSRTVHGVKVTNRGDCCGSRLSPFNVFVDKQFCATSKIEQGQTLTVKCVNGTKTGSKVTIIVYKKSWLTLCEVGVAVANELQDDPLPDNVMWVRMTQDKTMQSSTAFDGLSARAVDGDYSGQWQKNSCTHTDFQDNPWWFVDLGRKHKIRGIKVSNRADCCGNRLSPFFAFVDKTLCAKSELYQGMVLTVGCKPEEGIVGRFLTIKLFGPKRALSICEVGVAVDPFEDKRAPLAPARQTAIAAGKAAAGVGGVATTVTVRKKGKKPSPAQVKAAKDLKAAVFKATRVQAEIPFAFEQKERTVAGKPIVSLEFQPKMRAVSKAFLSQDNKKVTSTIPWWSMRKKAQPWCVDLVAMERTWKVRVNGQEYPELELNRNAEDFILGVKTNMQFPHYLLIPPEATMPSEPVSVNTLNGCKDHTYTMNKTTATFSFILRAFTLKGAPCIRCEPKPIDKGSHLFLKGGKLVFVVDGAMPRVQTFHKLFLPDNKYRIDVSYISLENAVELYVNDLRVEVLLYKKAPSFPLRPGRLGCATRSKDDGRMLTGLIINFKLDEHLHRNRPLFDRCDHYACAPGSVPKPDRIGLFCQGPVCTLRDQAQCCIPCERCSDYQCVGETRKKVNAVNITCDTPSCLNYECCDPVGRCSAFTCPRGNILKAGPQHILCDETKCVAKDVNTCCDSLGTCSDFACPDGYSMKPHADKIFCADRVCKETEYETCCAQNGYCTTLDCKAGYVLKPMAAQIPCAEVKCSHDADFGTCCDPKAPCGSMTCRQGYIGHKDMSLRCESHTCTEHDHDTCCVSQPSCSTMTCPTLTVLRLNASALYCADEHCKDTDYKTCCEPRGTCDAHSCPKHYVLKADSSSIHCEGATCDSDIDHDTCCTPVALCHTFACPPTYLPKANLSDEEPRRCVGSRCTEEKDLDGCCIKEGTCASLLCPQGFIHRPKSNETYCGVVNCTDANYSMCCDKRASCTQEVCKAGRVLRYNSKDLFCKGPTCTAEDDMSCCVDQTSCSSMHCPYGMIHRPNISRIMCYGHACNPSTDDLWYCCDRRANCSTLTCPAPHLVSRADAAQRLCKGAECNVAVDVGQCCTEAGRCNSLQCPAGYVQRKTADNLYCDGLECNATKVNYRTCCQPAPRCSTLPCPHTMTLRANASQVLCDSHTCNRNETDKCCEKLGRCTDLQCPNSTVHKADADKLLCTDPWCNTTRWQDCCTEKGTCLTMACPIGHIHRWNASRAFCKQSQCSASDVPQCCELATPCHHGACFTNMTLRPGNAAFCQARICNPAVDAEFCCFPKATCSYYSCPANFLPRPNAHELLCADTTCKESDYRTCCQKRASCDTYHCPNGHVAKDSSASIFCKGLQCGDVDRDTCCNRRALCNSIHCPTGKVHALDAAWRFCAGSTCTYAEIPQCCAPSATCKTMSCPSGQVYRPGAVNFPCGAASCANKTSFCCEDQGTCKDHMCPTGFAMRPLRPREFSDNCLGLEELCLRVYSPAGCASLKSLRECEASFAYSLPDTMAPCTWTAQGACVDTQREISSCRGLSPPMVEEACHALTCKYHLRVSHAGNSSSYVREVRGMPGEAFHFSGCTTNGTEGRHCRTVWGVPGGVQLLRNTAHKVVATGSCCTDSEDVILSVQSWCPALNVSGNGTGRRCALGRCKFEECCQATASCSSLVCPAGTHLIPGAGKVHCKGSYCTEDDVPTCCEPLGTCADYVCPHQYAKRHDAARLHCRTATCDQTDYNVCCAHKNRCTTLVCPQHYAHKPDHNSTFCPLGACTPADRDLCCGPRPFCDSMSNALCPEGTHVAVNATRRCAGTECATKVDAGTCCEMNATCDWFDCPHGYMQRSEAYKIWCEGRSCHRTDYHRCCVQQANCSSYSECPEGWILRQEASNLICQSSPCSSSTDLGLCCERKGTCAEMRCPEGYATRTNSTNETCAGRVCLEEDTDKCCALRAPCASFDCPDPLWISHPNASLDVGLGGSLCKGDNCTWESDGSTCCLLRANCTDAACSPGFALRVGGRQRLCANDTCVADVDNGECCQEAGSCHDYDCPDTYLLRPNASAYTCTGVACTNIDQRTCCLPKDRCKSIMCPIGYVQVSNAADVPCQGTTCNTTDVYQCCDPVASCDKYDCRIGFTHKDHPEGILCRGTACNDLDLHTCCRDAHSCSSYTCPSGYVQRPNASSIDCVGGNCSAVQQSACCAVKGSCASLECPVGMVHQVNVEKLLCDSHACTEDDALFCCEYAASCETMQCPDDWKAVAYPEKHYCAGANCTAQDVQRCCLEINYCLSYVCPTGLSHRADAATTQCVDSNCQDGDNNTAKCCAEDASCLTYKCPGHLAHHPNASTVSCFDVICRDADKYRCCGTTTTTTTTEGTTSLECSNWTSNGSCSNYTVVHQEEVATTTEAAGGDWVRSWTAHVKDTPKRTGDARRVQVPGFALWLLAATAAQFV